jgi:hypothetical protein
MYAKQLVPGPLLTRHDEEAAWFQLNVCRRVVDLALPGSYDVEARYADRITHGPGTVAG